ncbi:MAG: hypothetical protein GXO91_10205 [FCB group bacterium]|nr:hypothetical protein [FCB group bacterium]
MKSLLIFLIIIFNLVLGITIDIPGDYSTIQEGIDNAVSGDIILVQPGTYRELLNTQGKQIEFQSLYAVIGDISYIDNTILSGDLDGNGTGDGTVITIENEQYNENAHFIGFTIRAGVSVEGGGMYCFQSAPTISNCKFLGNSADFGGGLWAFNSQIIIDGTIFRENSATEGGGIYAASSTIELTDSILETNDAERGGGVFELYFTEFTNLRTFYYNNTADYGGSIYSELDNCQIINCTLTGNSALFGGNIYIGSQGSVTVLNSIFWNDIPEEVYFNQNEFSGSFTVSYSDIDGGEAGVATNNNGVLNWNEGNINGDPLFLDPENDDFHLTTDSPCIDAGNPDPQYDDPDGTRNDMGASFFGQLPGCMDPAACNYDDLANHDDGSCLYEDCFGECGGSAFIDDCQECVGGSTGLEPNYALDDCGVCFGSNADLDCNGDCFGSAVENECGCVDGNTGLELDYCYGCTDPAALNYDPAAWIENGSCYYDYDILGCTDAASCNYNPDATYDDGSCLYLDCAGECGGTAVDSECGCVGGGTGLESGFCIGCTDPAAINYDPVYTINDGNCQYGLPGDINQDNGVNVLDVVTIVDMILNMAEPTPYELNTGDVDCGGTLDIVDIVIIINCIINSECDMGCGNRSGEQAVLPPVIITTSNRVLHIAAEEPIGGFQLRTSGDFGLSVSDLPEGWQLHKKDDILLAFDIDRSHPTREILLNYSGELTVMESIVTNLAGIKLNPALNSAP